MSTAHLITMVNDIAAFFDSASDAGEAAKNVATHLRRFWDPSMRRQIIESLAMNGSALTPLARAAVELLANESEEQRRESLRR